MTREEAEDHAAVKHQHQQRNQQTFEASTELGLSNEVTPKPEHPAAGTNMVGISAERPNKQATNRDHRDADSRMRPTPFIRISADKTANGNALLTRWPMEPCKNGLSATPSRP